MPSCIAPSQPVHGGLTGQLFCDLYEHPRLAIEALGSGRKGHAAADVIDQCESVLAKLRDQHGPTDAVVLNRNDWDDAQEAYRTLDSLLDFRMSGIAPYLAV